MTTFRRLLFPILLGALATLLRGQITNADEGELPGAAGVIAVDAATGPAGRLLTKLPGYYHGYPPELEGRPDFRVQSLLYGQEHPPLGTLEIDAFSIGMDWIIADEIGRCRGPESAGWAVLMFSVTRTTSGAAGGVIAFENGNGGDRAAGDVFSYEFKGSAAASLSQDKVVRTLDSTDINILPASGTANITAYDWFAATYAAPEFEGVLPLEPAAYFSVTHGTRLAVPPEWCGGNVTENRSGATVFKSTWQRGAWSTPTVYLSPAMLGLATTADVDALAVDTLHHFNNYILFSTANPLPLAPRIEFLNRGTGYKDVYRFVGGPPVESQLGLGGGDVDALCAADPGRDDLMQYFTGVETPPPSWWPPFGPVSCVVNRLPGSTNLHGFAASGDLTATHQWWVMYPDLQQYSWSFESRQSAWKGAPSELWLPMSTAMLGQRTELGVIETGQSGTVGSRVVGITEWRERHQGAITVPAAFAPGESSYTGVFLPTNPYRAQCFYDTSNFTDQGLRHPIRITRIALRQDGPAGPAGPQVTYPQVDLWLGNAAGNYLTPSATFQQNITPGHTLVYSGPITVSPAFGDQPNHFLVDVELTSPFDYDASAGQDLLLEIEVQLSPAPAFATFVSCSHNATTHRAKTVIAAGNPMASSGVSWDPAPVCRFGYEELGDTAVTTAYGTGCYGRFRSFYELFPSGAFDLGGFPTNTIRLVPVGGDYSVIAGSGAWYPPGNNSLALVDDNSALVPLPQMLQTPAGSTNQLRVFSNGFVTLGPTAVAIGYAATAPDLLAGPARYALCWADLWPDGGNVANVFVDQPPGTNMFYVTWQGVPTFEPGGNVTMQLAFDLFSMEVEYRWRSCTLPSTALVGWSPGGSGLDPGNRDLHELPFATGADRPALAVRADRAIVGTWLTSTVDNIELVSGGAVLLISFGRIASGVDLGFLGLPDCRLYVDILNSQFFFVPGAPTTSFQLLIPNIPSLAGIELYFQAIGGSPGANPAALVTSNGLTTRVGLQ